MTISPSPTDVAWAAGLFEGEGCFNTYQTTSGHSHLTQARLRMTDRDVVERFASVVGVGTVRGPIKAQNVSWTDTWEWYVNRATEVRTVIALLLPWLGARRTAKALEVDAVAAAIRPKNERTHCPRGHELAGDNLRLEPIKRDGREYVARRCKTCRQSQERDRARRVKGITPDRYRIHS